MKLDEKIDKVMIGGNHLVDVMAAAGLIHPEWHRHSTYEAMRERYDRPACDAWVAWKAIMDLRDSWELLKKSGAA